MRKQLGLPPAEPARARPPAPVPSRPEDAAARLAEVRLLAQAQDRLAAAQRTIAGLEEKLREAGEAVGRLTVENQSLGGVERELREKIESSVKLIEALETEMRGKNERLAALEAAGQSLRKQLDQSRERTARPVPPPAWIAELEEINRRRETYLTSVLRRYREITDMYRGLSARLENPRETSAPYATEAARIQEAITAADEDLRQLRVLNAQAARLQARAR